MQAPPYVRQRTDTCRSSVDTSTSPQPFARETVERAAARHFCHGGARGDGLTAALRKRYPDRAHVGIELEVSQRLVEQCGAPWDRLKEMLVDSLGNALAASRR